MNRAIGVDKDCADGRVYWSDISAKAIFSAKYDGTDKKTFISENIMSPEGRIEISKILTFSCKISFKIQASLLTGSEENCIGLIQQKIR